MTPNNDATLVVHIPVATATLMSMRTTFSNHLASGIQILRLHSYREAGHHLQMTEPNGAGIVTFVPAAPTTLMPRRMAFSIHSAIGI